MPASSDGRAPSDIFDKEMTPYNNKRTLLRFVLRKIGQYLPDRLFLLLKYYEVFGRFPKIRSPHRFTEVVQWTKLFDRNPLYHKLVDKADVKTFVSSIIGSQYIVPTLGVWDSVDKINWNILPDQFVIKCTHDSGSTIICKDKAHFDMAEASTKLETALKRNFFIRFREWVYKGLTPRIIAEEYLGDNPTDYKFYCFNGQPIWLYVTTDRESETKLDFFDMDYNHLNVRNACHPNAATAPEKPQSFEQMKQLAAALSNGIPQVRVDFYNISGRIYFGELTFCQGGGFEPFEPDEADLELGSYFLQNLCRRTSKQ